jgi:hypothetical protein
MDAKKRIRDLNDPFLGPPLGGAFSLLRDLTAAGYNDIGPEEEHRSDDHEHRSGGTSDDGRG